MRRRLVVGSLVCVLLLAPTYASATGHDGGGRGGGGNRGDEDITEDGGSSGEGVFSEIELSNSRDDSAAPKVAEPVRAWEPPACWYEPRTASEIRVVVQQRLQDWQLIPEVDIAPSRDKLLDYYEKGSPYTNYNLDVEDEGVFWVGVVNPDRRDDPGAFSCSWYGTWAEHGEPPPEEPRVITPLMMAEAAYEWLPLPDVELALSPGAELPQVVNLATWIWQDTGLAEVSATAALDRLDLAVTTTATPVSLTLDPGTADATVHAGDGHCPVNADGSIGQAWSPDRKGETPPCGITYHRAGDGFDLTATVTWSVSWTGTGQPVPEQLPDAVMETSHTLTVREVQTIVR